MTQTEIFTSISQGLYLTPSDAAMSLEHRRAWLLLRGVRPGAEMIQALEDTAGRTEAELDAEYDACHGSIA